MATSRTNVHHVVGVKVARVKFDDFHSLEITLTTADGSTFTFDAFSAEPLAMADVAERTAMPVAAKVAA